MPLIDHVFEPDEHMYKVKGNFVLSTSDVLSLNGLRLYNGVPPSVMEKASERGRQLHDAVQCYEEDRDLPDLSEESHERFLAYLRWKEQVGFRVAGPCERSLVYQHHGTEMLIGGTPDLVGFIGNDLYVVDLKTCFRQSGQAKKQKTLEWRLQTQSYLEALAEDEVMWETWGAQQMHRAVLHLHPDCGIVQRGGARLGYEAYLFPGDDADGWNAAVTMAMLKLSSGHKMPDRE